MLRAATEFVSLLPVLVLLMDILRWLDAYRAASKTELPHNLPGRVLLARYNLLEVSTYIYRAYLATKKAQPVTG